MSENIQFAPTHQAGNILQLKISERFYGRLWKYQVGHSVLTLQISKASDAEENAIYVGFMTVRYIDLPIYWQGGNIKTASEDECLAQLLEVNFFENSRVDLKESQDSALSFMRLFLIDTPKKQYKILAANSISVTSSSNI